MTTSPTDAIDLTQPDDERDPDIVEGVRAAILGERAKMRTALPGVVQSYNAATQRATVQSGVALRLLDGTTETDPLFVDVPVVYPGAGGYSIHYPLAAGDECLILCSERSMDEWLAEGGYNVAPGDPRRFSAQDAICLPGLRSAPNALPAAARPADALTIASADGAVRIEVRAGGVVTIFADEVRLGDDSATFLALASLVDARFSQVAVAFDAHVHVSAAPGSPTSTPQTITDVGPPPIVAPSVLAPLASVAATKSKGV